MYAACTLILKAAIDWSKQWNECLIKMLYDILEIFVIKFYR